MDKPTLITLILTLASCGIAVVIERFGKLPLMAAQFITLAWGLQLGQAFFYQYEKLPPIPWALVEPSQPDEASNEKADLKLGGISYESGDLKPGGITYHVVLVDNEPWEHLVWPLMIVCIAWPLLRQITGNSFAWRTWVVFATTTVVVLMGLSQTERFQHLFIGNGYWVAASLLVVGANALTLERMIASGAGRWVTLVLLAQLLTVTALVMTCYGSWGEWCKQISAALAVIAIVRICVYPKAAQTQPTIEFWSTSLVVPVLVLGTSSLMHIRDYSQIALPTWLAPLVLLMPTVVGLVDQNQGVKRGPMVRVLIAAATSLVLGSVAIGAVLAQSTPE